jgi:hypothetical protein
MRGFRDTGIGRIKAAIRRIRICESSGWNDQSIRIVGIDSSNIID